MCIRRPWRQYITYSKCSVHLAVLCIRAALLEDRNVSTVGPQPCSVSQPHGPGQLQSLTTTSPASRLTAGPSFPPSPVTSCLATSLQCMSPSPFTHGPKKSQTRQHTDDLQSAWRKGGRKRSVRPERVAFTASLVSSLPSSFCRAVNTFYF